MVSDSFRSILQIFEYLIRPTEFDCEKYKPYITYMDAPRNIKLILIFSKQALKPYEKNSDSITGLALQGQPNPYLCLSFLFSEVRRWNSTSAEEVARLRLFSNPSWLTSGRTYGHQKLVPTMSWIDNCLMVTKC